MAGHRLPEDVAPTTMFAVLAVIAYKPSTSAEVAHATYIGRDCVAGHLKKLEHLGWIVQRLRDRKWVMRVLLAPLEVPEPTGVPGERPKLNPKRVEQPVLGSGFMRPVLAPGEEQPLVTPTDPPEGAPAPQDWRSSSEKLAEQWSLPYNLKGIVGCIAVGKIAQCSKCGKPTPVRYGEVVVCPICARNWGNEGK